MMGVAKNKYLEKVGVTICDFGEHAPDCDCGITEEDYHEEHAPDCDCGEVYE